VGHKYQKPTSRDSYDSRDTYDSEAKEFSLSYESRLSYESNICLNRVVHAIYDFFLEDCNLQLKKITRDTNYFIIFFINN